MNEYPLAVGFDDLENLQTLRSRGAFVIAATQGFLALDQMVGSRIRQALVAGFQNILAMQSHEPEVDLLMAMIMGQREIIERRKSFSSDSDLLELIPSSIGRQMVPVCPPGALARLQAFQAHVSLANGVHPSQPVWLVPRFVKVEPAAAGGEATGSAGAGAGGSRRATAGASSRRFRGRRGSNDGKV